ncbi:ribosome small subunit-dependent GTPase A [Novipirellula artificiosorum]|uniref:Small ribosomal subunit biogenesis GTPase RsgA n=1 Tax=Novipirellula artificiosorum TaxID=2528016 RepID=A0A5C6E3B1_9BACT|nr:ribosome small subunit-dependent GTPase A [Novipirellula artificiosorum]TWU42457.1 putative ribosome biogenesis GTPase RsgA [Novipirellula artificiosorum]
MDYQQLGKLGWKSCFGGQLTEEEERNSFPVRVAAHFGSRVLCLTGSEEIVLPIEQLHDCGELAVGDWLLLDNETRRGVSRLPRESLISRKAAGVKSKTQLIAANVDTLFIVCSCNHDFNLSRLERYLAVASESRVTPIVVLTKADLCEDRDVFRQQALQLQSGLIVETVDARDTGDMEPLAYWCRSGQTVALVGSSGAGKSTLAMSLGAGPLLTQGIREDDSKGRHTTTVRSIHCLSAGGVLIDTPGMRELQLADCEEGVAKVFDEIVALAEECQFRDCSHQGEPGCAIAAAIQCGELDTRRLKNYQKLQAEQARNAQSLHERREQDRKLGHFYKATLSANQKRKY